MKDIVARRARSTSELPGQGAVRIRFVRAEEARPDARRQMEPEVGVPRRDAANRGPDTSRDVHSRALGVRGGHSIAGAEAARPSQLAGDEVHLFPDPCRSLRVVEGPRLLEL